MVLILFFSRNYEIGINWLTLLDPDQTNFWMLDAHLVTSFLPKQKLWSDNNKQFPISDTPIRTEGISDRD